MDVLDDKNSYRDALDCYFLVILIVNLIKLFIECLIDLVDISDVTKLQSIARYQFFNAIIH